MAETTALHHDLSAVVRHLMDEATDTQPATGAALARALESHPPVVSNKLKNTRVWSLDDFFALATLYGITPGALADMMSRERANRAALDEIKRTGQDEAAG